ncbi:type VII secretion protein EccB [Actinoplanes derwentensis]|uniref:Type VII secretion protein EccB n=1 Tax=Actinoplanes derwentensis TaxID=113562 RepID=A0A1H2C7F9_9ACTN|nr:type VII secretion protein EccB [Actinoplanes derwentensis]GID86548.1 type VII secretion protein EccB [Actinoplanes derwentensis]SDT66465.1 type VII secretion protein EccB [Actinoplanes derwentensis]
MESRRDQVHAYFYVVSRLNAALMKGRPDPYEPPNHRAMLGFVIGILLAVVIAGGFGIYGIFRPGGDKSWRQAGVVIAVKETGARYLLMGDQLRPVLNYSSARLVLGGDSDPRMVQVSRESLKGIPVGAPIGIPGAPDSVPAASRLYTGAWTVCAQPPTPAGAPATTLLLGDVTAPVAVTGNQAFLAQTADLKTYLIWQGRRYRLTETAAVALGYAAVEPALVTAAWLNPIPPGRDLAFPVVANRGRTGPSISGRASTIGQIYEVQNPASGTSEQFLARGDGFVRLSRTSAALLLADPAIRQAYAGGAVVPIPIRPDELAGATVSKSTELMEGYPPAPPSPVTGGGGLPCVAFRSSGTTVSVSLSRVSAAAADAALPVPRLTAAGGTVDRVLIAAGTGVLARNPYAPGTPGGALFLITEYGVKHPLRPDGVQALGYSGQTPVDVPSELLELLPTGAVLDPAAALQSLVWGG